MLPCAYYKLEEKVKTTSANVSDSEMFCQRMF